MITLLLVLAGVFGGVWCGSFGKFDIWVGGEALWCSLFLSLGRLKIELVGAGGFSELSLVRLIIYLTALAWGEGGRLW